MGKDKKIESQRQMILEARSKGKLATLGVFARFSGPGWMQSATTLGGGSLASALYLGVLGGFGFMWLQPSAMILGIIMLSAISYITLSIKDKPVYALNKNISPVLGWGWAWASMLSCLVFAMPQFSLGVAAIQQNLFSGFFGEKDLMFSQILITIGLICITLPIVAIYSRGGKGIKLFETVIKLMVALIVICFVGVVIKISLTGDISWNKIFSGFIPNFDMFTNPAEGFVPYLDKLGDSGKAFWTSLIVGNQRDVMISAAAMAVGINMTFLFPYSMLKKGWDKDFRGLAIFDLAVGLFVPFFIATACIVIASASQFHAKPAEGLVSEVYVDGKLKKPAVNLVAPYNDLLKQRLIYEIGADKFNGLSDEQKVSSIKNMDVNEKTMAAVLVKRDAFNLADTLAPLVGEDVAKYIFGIGVLGMAVNAIIMLMLICGLCFSEIFGKSGNSKVYMAGSSLIIISGIVSLFWSGAKMWLAVYAGVITMTVLPLAYASFTLMMNSDKILGKERPLGLSRITWNIAMCVAVIGSFCGSLWVLHSRIGNWGFIVFGIVILLVVVTHKRKFKETK